MTERDFDYDVGLSFAGEQRDYVNDVANDLKARGIHVFFDEFEQSNLWGKNLYEHLSYVYQRMCRYCVVFASKDYAAKAWPTIERQSAQARAIEAKEEYILPARFDDTPIPGILDTVHYIDLRRTSPGTLSDLLAKKLGKERRQSYLPPQLDRLYDILDIGEGDDLQKEVDSHAWAFFDVLRRMDPDERQAVTGLILEGCPTDFPESIHINADLLRRTTGMSVPRLKRHLGNIRSLGFYCVSEKRPEHHSEDAGEVLGDDDFFRLQWSNLSETDDCVIPALEVAAEMVVGATANLCPRCGEEALARLDFSQLASVTARDETHEMIDAEVAFTDDD